MRPTFEIDDAALAHNARAWSAFAGAPIRAVVKADAYGVGARRIVRAIDDDVAGYFVADVEEFDALRDATARPIATFADVPIDRIADVLDRGGIPNCSSRDAIDVARAWASDAGRIARVRIGVRPAIGWAGFDPEEIPALASDLASDALAIECWSHLTDEAAAAEQRAAFEAALAILRTANVSIVATDFDGTAALARSGGSGSFARVGIGLFGFRLGATIDVRSVFRLDAPIVSVERSRGQRVGYGTRRLPPDGFAIVVRCGYAEGLPREPDAIPGLRAVGMQYAQLHATRPPIGTSLALIDDRTDLDALCARARIDPHEFMVRLASQLRC